MSLININLPVTVKSENSKVIVQSPDVDAVHTTIEPNNIIIKGPDASQGVSSTTTLIGGKISGLNAPTDDSDAANKKYVDDAVNGGGGSGDYLPLAGGTMQPNASVHFDDSVESLHNADYSYTARFEDSAKSTKVEISGNTINIHDTANGHNLELATTSLTFKNMSDGSKRDTTIEITANNNTLNFGGMPGKITNLSDPTNLTDVANKRYVDTQISSIGSGVKVIGPTKITDLGAGTGFCTVLDFGTSYLFIIKLFLCTMSAQKYAVAHDIPSLYVSDFNGMAPTAMGQMGKSFETIFTVTHNSDTNTVYIQPASNALPSGDSGTIVFWASKE